MRILVLALFFCLSDAALCQQDFFSAERPANSDRNALTAAQPLPDLSTFSAWRHQQFNPFVFQRPGAKILSTGPLGSQQATADAMVHSPVGADQLDAPMIIHPPQSSIGALPYGIPMQRNLYSNLQLQFIGQNTLAGLQPIPTLRLRPAIKAVPVAWSEEKIVPAQNPRPPTTPTTAK